MKFRWKEKKDTPEICKKCEVFDLNNLHSTKVCKILQALNRNIFTCVPKNK